jgi:lipopolysaccharide transport system permease protein
MPARKDNRELGEKKSKRRGVLIVNHSPKIKGILEYKELIRNLVVRDLKVRYKRSILGIFWALLEPLLLMILFTVVFSILLRIQIEKYPVFVLCGILPWSFFSTSLSYSAGSIAENAPLIKKIYFPREILPLTVIISRLLNFLVSLGLLLIFLIAFKVKFTYYLAYLPLILIVQIIFILGLSLFFSSLNTFFHDVGFILQFILFGWFYITPVFYPVTMVPVKFLSLYMLNPMATILHSYQNIIFYGKPPDFSNLLIALTISILCFFIGSYVFRRMEFRFAEVL